MAVFPALAGADGWRAVHRLPADAWRPALAAVTAALDLPSAGWERLPGGEDSAVFMRGDGVLKLVPPFLAGDAAREREVLPRLVLPVATPRLDGVVVLEGWTALRMARLPGVPADQRWTALSSAARLTLVEQVGELMAALRRTPLTPGDGDPVATRARLHARALRHEAAGFVGVEAFLARHLPALPAAAFVHFDLHQGNLLVGPDDRLAGVLDFVASRAFAPAADLVTPGVFLAAGDSARLRALVRAAGLDAGPEELAAWHLLHPFSDLRRDLALAGRSAGAALQAELIALWR